MVLKSTHLGSNISADCPEGLLQEFCASVSSYVECCFLWPVCEFSVFIHVKSLAG